MKLIDHNRSYFKEIKWLEPHVHGHTFSENVPSALEFVARAHIALGKRR